MKVNCTSGLIDDFVQRNYNNFSKRCLEGRASLVSARNDFYKYRDDFAKKGLIQDFFDKTLSLSNQIEKTGNTSLSSLLLNELCKLFQSFNLKGTPEKILFKAIENCQKNHDGLHELARINDLENFYRFTGNDRDLIKILHRKKNCCKKILIDYDRNAQNFKSLIKAPTSKEEVKAQLAFAYSSLGNVLAEKHPVDAITLFQKSKMINEKIGRYKAAHYAELCIRDIQNHRYYRR